MNVCSYLEGMDILNVLYTYVKINLQKGYSTARKCAFYHKSSLNLFFLVFQSMKSCCSKF